MFNLQLTLTQPITATYCVVDSIEFYPQEAKARVAISLYLSEAEYLAKQNAVKQSIIWPVVDADLLSGINTALKVALAENPVIANISDIEQGGGE